ncbi:MAG: hypothetical protein AB7E47_05115 [Desulfovibrionaceae bacterium]
MRTMPQHHAAHAARRWAAGLAATLLLAASLAWGGAPITVTGIVGVSDTSLFVMDDTGSTYLLLHADVLEGDRVRVVGELVDKNGEAAIEVFSMELLDGTPDAPADDAPAGGTPDTGKTN